MRSAGMLPLLKSISKRWVHFLIVRDSYVNNPHMLTFLTEAFQNGQQAFFLKATLSTSTTVVLSFDWELAHDKPTKQAESSCHESRLS